MTRKQIAADLRRRGYSYARIGTRLGVSDVTVIRWLNPTTAKKQRACRDKYRLTIHGRVTQALSMSKVHADKRGHKPCISCPTFIMNAFNGHCALCGTPENASKWLLHMDHCHITGKFRGWLCKPCNLWISRLEKQVVRLPTLIAYLTN